jgi:hypothetical protein
MAKLISYLSHPILATTYMLAFALYQKNSYLFYTVSPNGRLFLLLLTVALTVILPLFSVGYMIYTKQVSSFHLDKRQERIVPMSITIAYTLGLYYMMMKLSMPPIVLAITAVGVIEIAVTLIITLFWKVSAHMMGIAGFGGAVLAMSQVLHPIPSYIIVILFVSAGIIGSARIKQDSHTLGQVIVGWVLGFSLAYFTIIFLNQGII